MKFWYAWSVPNGASAWYRPSSQSKLAETTGGLSRAVQVVSLSIRNAAPRWTNAVASGATALMAPPQANRVIPAPPGLELPGQRSIQRTAVSIPAPGSGPSRKRDLDANWSNGTLPASAAMADRYVRSSITWTEGQAAASTGASSSASS